jgi:TetR/AcrR family transcriptional regulator
MQTHDSVRVLNVNEPRRSPRGSDRKRDPERTRERILEAALIEFGEHGFAGARISAIAGRAGVNEQLISYYFDGKEGLYRTLQQRWQMTSATASRPELALADVVARFLRLNIDQRSFARLLAWDGLADTGRDSDAAEPDPYFTEMVEDMRRRWRAGELADDLDPAYVLLMLFAAAFAPTVIPQIARRLTGLSVDSATFQEAYADQLRRVVERLSD